MLKSIKNLLNLNRVHKLSVLERIDSLFDKLREDIIQIHVGEDIFPYIDGIVETIGRLRHEIKEECGFILPVVNISGGYCLQENEYNIFIRGKEILTGFVIPTETEVKLEVYDALKTVVYDNINKLFTNEITERYIDSVQKYNSRLVWDLTSVLSVIDIRTILTDIIGKGKSINNIDYVFEKIGEQILSCGEYRDFGKRYNPHLIAGEVSKVL